MGKPAATDRLPLTSLEPFLYPRLCATKARKECLCSNVSSSEQLCCTRDEGGPLEAGVQAQASNRLELRGSRARVVSVEEKAGQDSVR
jgi:hypothetical protein